MCKDNIIWHPKHFFNKYEIHLCSLTNSFLKEILLPHHKPVHPDSSISFCHTIKEWHTHKGSDAWEWDSQWSFLLQDVPSFPTHL